MTSDSPATSPVASTPDLVQLDDVLVALLRARRLLVVFAVLGLSAGVAWALIPRRTWTAEAMFLPEQRRPGPSSLSGLSSQIGIAVGGIDGAQPGVLFVEVAKSRGVIDSLVDSKPYAPPGDSVAAKPLADWLRIDETDSKKRRVELRARLAASIDATTSTKTGLVTMRVSLPADWLATEVARRLIAQLDRVSVELRQRRAQAEKRFTDERMTESIRELHDAEQRVANFHVKNRDISRSPERQLELERLTREVALRQQLFASLANAAQQAALERQRDTPAVTVVQAPDLPLQPDRRFIARKALVGLLGTVALAMLIALLRYFWFTERRASSDVFNEELRATMNEVRRPWRLFFGSSRPA